jgi:hypothetical protein
VCLFILQQLKIPETVGTWQFEQYICWIFERSAHCIFLQLPDILLQVKFKLCTQPVVWKKGKIEDKFPYEEIERCFQTAYLLFSFRAIDLTSALITWSLQCSIIWINVGLFFFYCCYYLFSELGIEPETSHMYTWTMTPALFGFAFCFWDRFLLSLPGLDLNTWSSCLPPE